MEEHHEVGRIVLVGAIAVDTILSVPYYPREDEKLRATSVTRRRGGNVGNTAEVLQQLLHPPPSAAAGGATAASSRPPPPPELAVIATLPSRSAPDTSLIASSLAPHVDLRRAIYREEHSVPVSSYIIRADGPAPAPATATATAASAAPASTTSVSEGGGSRTIVNVNAMPEMTLDEFVSAVEAMCSDGDGDDDDDDDDDAGTSSLPSSSTPASQQHQHPRTLFHFEGRIPDVTLACIAYLRSSACPLSEQHEAGRGQGVDVSVEVEKPGRAGLRALAAAADVVFYSRAWAEAQGYGSAADLLRGEGCSPPSSSSSSSSSPNASSFMICTWGERGSAIVGPRDDAGIVEAPAQHVPSVVDAVGAGDTFVAAMLYCLVRRPRTGSALAEKLRFANALAARKIQQEGFQGLHVI